MVWVGALVQPSCHNCAGYTLLHNKSPENGGMQQLTLLPGSMGQEFRPSITGQICLCSMTSEASAGKTQTAGEA